MQNAKKSYVAPQVRVLGSLTTLTQGSKKTGLADAAKPTILSL